MKLTPENIRKLAFDEVLGWVNEERQAVYDALAQREPCTTRSLAEGMGHDLLTVRPRVSELLDLGLVELTGRIRHEGLYRAVPLQEARAAHDRRHQVGEEQRAESGEGNTTGAEPTPVFAPGSSLSAQGGTHD
jgi:hypothetical protein